jgi:alpha-glucosidase
MKSSCWAAGLFALSLLGSIKLFADDPAIQPLPNGISLLIAGKKIELRVASPHAFCLRVADPSAIEKPSIYLSNVRQPPTSFQVFHEGTAVGIQTTFGQILVDPSRRRWTLRDASGAILADWAPLAKSSLDQSQPSQPAGLELAVGGPPAATAPPLFYGSGNIPVLGALTQTEGQARTGNGNAALPQYWSKAGYGVLAIGASDLQPGSWKSEVGGDVTWRVSGASLDLYLAPASNLYDWLRDDAELTGFAPVPPRWTFGYLQSQWGWKDRAYLDDTLAHFRRDRLPVDAFIVDFEWYTTKPDYTVKPAGDPDFVDFDWNPALFPEPPKQMAGFAAQGLHLIGIRKPRVGNQATVAMARARNWLLPLNPLDPNPDVGIRSRNLDYSLPEVRTWWDDQNRKFLEAGMAAFWNDEGESTYVEYSYWNLAEIALFDQVRPGERFWSLNRSFIPGMQRLGAAVWTGDIAAKWKVLQITPGQLLSYSLSGMPYSTCDIGGFSLNTTLELLTRWMEAGVFFPLMRSHSENKSQAHFPWLYGPEAEAAMRGALDLRYRLIPYYYSLSHANSITAAPLMRPLAMEFPDDAQVSGLTDEWLMGKGLLAAPILNRGGARNVYLPKDRWFDFGTTHMTEGPQTLKVREALDAIPIYVRAGTLLPLGPVLQYTGQPTDAPLEMQIYPGRDATFDFVEDDGKTRDYQKGVERITHFFWNDQTQTVSWKVTGAYRGKNVFHTVRAILFSPQGKRQMQELLGLKGSISFR